MTHENDRAKVPDFKIPAMDVNVGTKPKESFWRRNPVPACNCELGFLCGKASEPWWVDPEAETNTPGCPTGTQFAPPHPGVYGYQTVFWEGNEDTMQGKNQGMEYSLVDKVRVPVQT